MRCLLLAGLLALAACASTTRLPSSIPGCAERPGSAPPDPSRPAGRADPRIPINHIVVIMQENHSFDSYFGRLNQPAFYGSEVDGIDESMFSYDEGGNKVHAFHQTTICPKDPEHTEHGMRTAWNEGRNDQFGKTSGPGALGYYDQRDLPFYYDLANHFAIADRYFSPMLGPTYPNRFFLYASTAFGHTDNTDPDSRSQYNQPTIFDVLDRYGISWGYYTNYYQDFHGEPGYVSLFKPVLDRDRAKVKTIDGYAADLAAGTLPAVVFLDADLGEDEHPDSSIQVGEAWVADKIGALMGSAYWKDSVLFLTYDEGGGFYDHVSPPAACAPDPKKPESFTRLGFRVPFVAVSPYAKRHFVSHADYEHGSILKFIETKFNLPPLTIRDARANGLLELFDFRHPSFEVPRLRPSPRGSCP